MFLRLGWVVGQAGIWFATGIILVSNVVTTITALSMSAIATNGKVMGGGAYYLISRSLGPQFGGIIGLLFSVGNSVAVALYLIGFSETFVYLLEEEFDQFLFNGHGVRIWAAIALLFLLIMALIGVGWVIKLQLLLLAGLIITILSIIIGSFIDPQPDIGFTGWKGSTFKENMSSHYSGGEDLFTIFSVFFPAVTGIMAGNLFFSHTNLFNLNEN